MAIEHWNDSVLDLIPGYRKTKRSLEIARTNETDKAKKETLGSMISDVDYALEWMQHGGNPYRRRGVEARYERSWDPAWIDAYHSPSGWSVQRESRDLTDDERFRIEQAMADLSPRERKCFMLYYADGMSEYEIARELNLGRTTVQDYLKQARRKIEEAKMTNLFLV